MKYSQPSIGKHTVTTTYSGDGNFLASNSAGAPLTVTVQDPTGATSMFATVSAPAGTGPGTQFTIFAQVFNDAGQVVTSFSNRPAGLALVAGGLVRLG